MKNEKEINQQPETAANADGPKNPVITDPQEQIRKLGKGTLTLDTPIKAGDKDVTELHYDFSKLTGWEYADAMDKDSGGSNIFRITNKQAMLLFAATAGKETDGIDATDIRERIGVADSIKAVQLATVFFVASTRAGNNRITNG